MPYLSSYLRYFANASTPMPLDRPEVHQLEQDPCRLMLEVLSQKQLYETQTISSLMSLTAEPAFALQSPTALQIVNALKSSKRMSTGMPVCPRHLSGTVSDTLPEGHAVDAPGKSFMGRPAISDAQNMPISGKHDEETDANALGSSGMSYYYTRNVFNVEAQRVNPI